MGAACQEPRVPTSCWEPRGRNPGPTSHLLHKKNLGRTTGTPGLGFLSRNLLFPLPAAAESGAEGRAGPQPLPVVRARGQAGWRPGPCRAPTDPSGARQLSAPPRPLPRTTSLGTLTVQRRKGWGDRGLGWACPCSDGPPPGHGACVGRRDRDPQRAGAQALSSKGAEALDSGYRDRE